MVKLSQVVLLLYLILNVKLNMSLDSSSGCLTHVVPFIHGCKALPSSWLPLGPCFYGLGHSSVTEVVTKRYMSPLQLETLDSHNNDCSYRSMDY